MTSVGSPEPTFKGTTKTATCVCGCASSAASSGTSQKSSCTTWKDSLFRPRSERLRLLEATLPERLRIRTEAWRAALAVRLATSGTITLRDRRAAALLGVELPPKPKRKRPKRRRIGRFKLGGQPGPGRGHRGPIASYVAEHGCSRDTAWRRLRAS